MKNILRAFLFFAATLLLYLGLPMLGWGLSDVAGFISFGPRLGYAGSVGLFSLAVGVQAFSSTAGIRGGKGEAEKFVFRQRVVRIALVLTLYLVLFLVPFFDRRGVAMFRVGVPVQWIGVALSTAGYLLIFLSGVALGRQYSADVTIQEDHLLITSGIYKTIRHPRYLGIIALGVGYSLVFHSWVGVAVSLIATGVLLFRVNDEEMVLHKEFGTQWEAYCKRSWRLIPFIF